MTDERNMHTQNQGMMKPTYGQCKQYKYYHIVIHLNDGDSFDGIITDVGQDEIKMLVSEEVSDDQSGQRQFGYGGRYRYRRFRPRSFPLAALTSLALLPFVAPYAYSPYPYSYPYQYPYYY